MNYIAHKDEEREQTVLEHLCGTAELAQKFADKFGKGDWGYCCGMLHDIGKYSSEFQRKIKENTNEMVDHATAGAQLCEKLGGRYRMLEYCIAGHHAGLPDYENTSKPSTLCGRLKKRICDYQAYSAEVQIPELHTNPIQMEKGKDLDFSLSTFIRMLYSCLVDADFLDTEDFMKNGEVERHPGESMEVLLEKLDRHIAGWLASVDIDSVNGRRTEILKNCIANGERERGIFRLTVPTGGGKTIASLAFALNHAVKNQMDRVIYVIPYTSIIEQNAQVFRDILGEQNVLENHCNVDYEGSEELKPMQLASENWDKPVVVTTNVQFFESLFANKSSKCRKLHNIVNSVVIFDEAQMLPTNYMKPCIAMLQELVENYKTSVVLCTATQPTLDQFFDHKEITELCPRMSEQFRFFERVRYQNIGELSKEELAEKLRDKKSALCIVNTKKRAQEIYRLLEGEGVYHLSTSMYPKHRKRVLKKVRECLVKEEKCILIATSLVEAGVDLDFQTVYRQTAGVDSMIQAAGRCNREGKRDASESIVHIFDFNDRKKIKGQELQIAVARGVLSDYENVASLESIEAYFERLYHYRGTSLDQKNIMKEFRDKHGCYSFAKVGKEFKLIEQDTKTIFVAIEPEAKQLLEEIRLKGMSRSRMRKAGQYCIQVYDTILEEMNGAGMVRPVSVDVEDFYQLNREEDYTEEVGVDLSIDTEMALFF